MALALPGATAFAQDAAPAAERQAVQNRLFSNEGKFEAALALGATPSARLVRHGALDLSFGWNFTEEWSVHVAGTYAFSSHTGAADDAAESIQTSDPAVRFKVADDFSDLWEMDWAATAAVRWMPFYGKASLFSAAVLRLGLWMKLGAGIGGFSRESLVSPVLDDDAVKPLFTGAIGLRFYATSFLSFDLAVDARLFPDSYMVSVDRTDPGHTGEEKGGVTVLSFASLSAAFSF